MCLQSVLNRYKLTVRFANGGYKDFFVDEYEIDEHGFVTFNYKGKEKKHHVSNVDIDRILQGDEA